MGLTGNRTLVGFGFGPIQAGLFLYEAFLSGGFRRLVVGEVLPDVVEAMHYAGGMYCLNVAHSDHVEIARVGPVQVEDPNSPSSLRSLVEAVADAEEIATAVPSVRYYVTPSPGSIHRILAEGFRKKAAQRGPRAVIYAAENHNHAAEILESAVFEEIPEAERSAVHSRVRFLNTVIGKMSGVIADEPDAQGQRLATITPHDRRAFLVEAFNRILISKICFGETSEEARFQRGIKVFEEKEDLLPFEEAKLYGHNATHALACYVGALRGIQRIGDLRDVPEMLRFLRAAFILESGETLIRKHSGKDRLFTPEGYREYAEDLLERMTNPYLRDTVERVGRDPQRKLGWDDRLIGTMRAAMHQHVAPRRYALGAAAALAAFDRSFLESQTPAATFLTPLWGSEAANRPEARDVVDLIEDGRNRLRTWRESGFPDLEGFLQDAA